MFSCGALAPFIRLFAAGALFAALPTSAAVAGPRAYRVELSPMMILAPEAPRQPGEERAIRPGDVVLRAPLGWGSAARLERDAIVEVAGVRETLTSGVLLVEALQSRGGDLDELPEGARIYCAAERMNSTNVLASAMTLGLSNLATRLSRVIRFCLVDAEVDGSFERGFLVGTKRDEDRRMVQLQPVPYAALENQRVPEGHFVEVTYDRAGLLGNAAFQIERIVPGGVQAIQAMITGDPGNTTRTNVRSGIRSGRVPYPATIGPAQLTVLSFDAETKEARIRYDRDLSPTPVRFTLPPQTIYIYVPG